MFYQGFATTVLLSTLAATTPPAWCQPRLIKTVRGEVRKERIDGRLIPGSLVAVSIAPAASASGQARSTLTGWDGFYYFQDIQPGSYTLTVVEKGRPQPQTFRVDLRQTPTTDVPPIILSSHLMDYRTAYGNALRAIDLEDWSAAVYVLQQLLTLHPENASTRKELIPTTASHKELYRPRVYLGLALQKLGDCDGALREWKSEESLGELKSTHWQAIREGRIACSRVKH